MRILSILVNSDSFYYAVLCYGENKQTLIDIDYARFDFSSKNDTTQNIPKTRAGLLLTDYATQWNVDKISISPGDSYADFAKIPNIDSNPSQQSNDIYKLYVNQVYNSDDTSDFEIESALFSSAPDEALFLSSFVPSDVYYTILKTFGLNNFPIIKAGTNFFNSIRAFEFNYPVLISKTNLLISLNNDSIINAIFQNGLISDFSINFSESDWENVITDLLEKHQNVDNVFVFGNSLNKQKYDFICQSFDKVELISRLGAFDNLSHNLDSRHLDFAGRMFHNYTGVISAIIDNPQSSIIGFNK